MDIYLSPLTGLEARCLWRQRVWRRPPSCCCKCSGFCLHCVLTYGEERENSPPVVFVEFLGFEIGSHYPCNPLSLQVQELQAWATTAAAELSGYKDINLTGVGAPRPSELHVNLVTSPASKITMGVRVTQVRKFLFLKQNCVSIILSTLLPGFLGILSHLCKLLIIENNGELFLPIDLQMNTVQTTHKPLPVEKPVLRPFAYLFQYF